MEQVQTASDFDKLFVQVIGETFNYCLGEVNANIICNYFEGRNLPLHEIPNNLELFSEELRKILGFGSRQILCAASILEETLLELLCKKLEMKVDFQKPVNFPLELRKIRAAYINGGE